MKTINKELDEETKNRLKTFFQGSEIQKQEDSGKDDDKVRSYMFNINEISNEDKDLVDAIQQQKIQNVMFH